jgi:uncharacterized membrane protein
LQKEEGFVETKYLRNRFLKIFLIVFLCLFLLSIFPSKSYAKDYYFPFVTVRININNDGSFDVTEERTYNFSGSYTWATYTLQKGGYDGVENFSIEDENGYYERVSSDQSKPGTYTFTESGSNYVAKFYYLAIDQSKTFTFRYTISGGIKAYQDVADFYWKLVGSAWEKRTVQFDGYIYFPSQVDESDFYVFGHGPLQGTVEKIDGNGAHYQLTNLPAYTYVEARVIFPSDILNMEKIQQNQLSTILTYERNLAEQANRQRTRDRINFVIALILPLGVLVLWLYLFFKYGKEHPPRIDVVYTRDIPEDLPPAIVGYLMRFKSITPYDFTATIMNLVRKGFIAIQTQKEMKGFIFRREVPVTYLSKTAKDPEEMLGHERIVYNFLFTSLSYEGVLSFFKPGRLKNLAVKNFSKKQGTMPGIAGVEDVTVSTDDIKEFIKKNPQEFKGIYDAFKGVVKDEGEEKNYFEKKSEMFMGIFIAIGIVFGIIGFFLLSVLGILYLIPLYIIASVLFVILAAPLQRRTQEGADAYALWNGLKKFLRDFSNLKEAIPTSIALWEQYLVYAVTFGISEKVIKEMEVVLPQIPEDELRTSHFFVAGAVLGSDINIAQAFNAVTSSMISSFNSIASSASSTGGGGGFSGGGGGGGGGSGGGAG